MEISEKDVRPISEVIAEAKRRFKEMNGRLLTEEEAVELTEEIKREIRREESARQGDGTRREECEMLDHKLFDHTILKADATEVQVRRICSEAKEHGFASVCVNGFYTALVAEELRGTDVKVCTVVGFPLGQSAMDVKVFETKKAIADGAQEVDMVINVAALKDGQDGYVQEEIEALKMACGADVVLKVIIETCLLTDEEKKRACLLAKAAGADFVKTSTGFSTGGAKASDVKLMRETVGTEMGVKASGGIHTKEEAQEMVDAGASRLGTSATLAIIGN